ncbi:MAG: primosomal replication protein N, partial [Rubrivivax sp.]
MSAIVVQVQSLRYTPAGIPAVNLVIEHESEVVEMDTPRQVKVQLKALAFGAQAEVLSRQGLDSVCEFHG